MIRGMEDAIVSTLSVQCLVSMTQATTRAAAAATITTTATAMNDD